MNRTILASDWWQIANEVVINHLDCKKCVNTWPLCFREYRDAKLIATMKGIPCQYNAGNPFEFTCLETKKYRVDAAIAVIDAKNLPEDEQIDAIMVLVDRWLKLDYKAKRAERIRKMINGEHHNG